MLFQTCTEWMCGRIPRMQSPRGRSSARVTKTNTHTHTLPYDSILHDADARGEVVHDLLLDAGLPVAEGLQVADGLIVG